MKKLLAVLLIFSLFLSALPVRAMPRADRTEEELYLTPGSITMPVFSNVSGERLRAYAGGVYTPAYNFTWSISDPSVAAVDEDGYIWAIAPGTAVVTAEAADGRTAQSVVTVVPDADFTTVDLLDFEERGTAFCDAQVGIGPLYGATPVILQREIPFPACPTGRYYEGQYDSENGWAYTYAVGYHITVPPNHTLSFVTSAYEGGQANDVNTFITLFNSDFENTGYKFNYDMDPYAELIYTFDRGGDYYVVITPLNYNVIPGNGYIKFTVTDLDEDTDFTGDVNGDGIVTFADVSALYMYLVGYSAPDAYGLANADVDRNGAVNFGDVSALYGMLVNG